MAVQQDAPFLSAAAAGEDWREIVRAVFVQLQENEAALRDCTLGFIYITDALGGEAPHILKLLRDLTGIAHWVGTVGVGVCAGGTAYIDRPALSVMTAAIDPAQFRIFPPVDMDMSPALQALAPFLAEHDPMLVLMHGDPLADNDPAFTLERLQDEIGGFSAGGLASARGLHLQIADDVVEGGLSGAVFDQDIAVATCLSQGCAPLGCPHKITACEDNVIMALDDEPAFVRLGAHLQDLLAAGDGRAERQDDGTIRVNGEVHVAFPVPGCDNRDYMVRHALGIDTERGWIAVPYKVAVGDEVMFVHRDDATMRADLSRALVELRSRITREQGRFAPRGALYISCVARAGADFTGDGPGDAGGPGGPGSMTGAAGEMALVREVLGDIPLTGFYANGEIANGHLYGYTAVVILFL